MLGVETSVFKVQVFVASKIGCTFLFSNFMGNKGDIQQFSGDKGRFWAIGTGEL